jgi:hypothetical protein
MRAEGRGLRGINKSSSQIFNHSIQSNGLCTPLAFGYFRSKAAARPLLRGAQHAILGG